MSCFQSVMFIKNFTNLDFHSQFRDSKSQKNNYTILYDTDCYAIIKCFLNLDDGVFILIEELKKDKDIKFPFCADKNVNDALRKFNHFFKIVALTNEHKIISYKQVKSKCILIYVEKEIWITPSVELSIID